MKESQNQEDQATTTKLGEVPMEDLWERAKEGDQEATDELFRRQREYWERDDQRRNDPGV